MLIVTVAVFDKPAQPKTSFQSVKLIVLNVNDYEPEFVGFAHDSFNPGKRVENGKAHWQTFCEYSRRTGPRPV